MRYIIARALFFIIAIALTSGLFAVEARAEKRIGVLLWTNAKFYSDAMDGIRDHLKKAGFEEPNAKYVIEHAEGSKVKAAALAQKFAAAKLDLIFTIGTPATIAVSKEIKDIPIVFSMVYDPIEAGIAKSWKGSGNNTTGSSSRVPMSSLVNTLKEFAPVKKLAVLYTPGEKNSEIQLKELQGLQTNSKIKIVPVILTNKEEVAQTLATVVPTVDAIYLSGSSIASTSASLISDIATKAKVITIAHLDDLVEKGALLGVCANPYLVGSLAGQKAIKVLKGAKPSSIPIEFEKKVDVIVNMKTAKAGQFQIPSAFMKKVTKTIE